MEPTAGTIQPPLLLPRNDWRTFVIALHETSIWSTHPKSEKNFGRSSKHRDAENFLKLIRGYVKGIISVVDSRDFTQLDPIVILDPDQAVDPRSVCLIQKESDEAHSFCSR